MLKPRPNLAWVLDAIRRRRLVFAAPLSLGLVLGILYAATRPPFATAQATVLLPPVGVDSHGQPTRDKKTEVALVSSLAVLDRAGQRLTPRVAGGDLSHEVSAAAPTDAIIAVRGRATSLKAAVARANAVADAFVTFTAGASTGQIEAVLGALHTQASALMSQISDLEKQITASEARLAALPPGSPQAVQVASLVDSLRSQQANAAGGLNDANNNIATAQLSGAINTGGTKVLDWATDASRPSLVRRWFFGIAPGVLLGLLVGGVGVLAIDKRDRRLRWRDDIADAIGIPVAASVQTKRGRAVQDLVALLQHYGPSPRDSWNMRQAFRHLGLTSDEPSNVTVVSLARDEGAWLVAPQMAAFAAGIGINTALVVPTNPVTVAPVRCAVQVVLRSGGPRPGNLWVQEEPDDAEDPDRAALTVTLWVFDPETKEFPHPGRRTTTVLAVSAGFATADELAEVAIAAADGHQYLDGVVVANPAADDRTAGTFPRLTRATGPSVPKRVTGVAR
jgi:capsular polysaccharide biosynthesis protein